MRISDWSSDVCSSDLENGWVNDSDSARRWLEDQLLLNLARFEAPLLLAHCEAAAQDDWPRLLLLAAEHRARRETREDRKSGGQGQRVPVRVQRDCQRTITKKNK